MSKAILVIDMPKSCLECNFRRIENRGVWKGFSSCGLTKEIIWCDLSSKPIECPLRPLPDRKKETDASTDYEYYRMQGYNMCVDELGGAE